MSNTLHIGEAQKKELQFKKIGLETNFTESQSC